MNVAAKTLLVALLFLLAGCDILEQVSGVDPVKNVVRDNPVDPQSSRPLVFGLDVPQAVVGTVRPSIVFQFSPGVASYTLQIDDTADFASALDYEEAGIAEGTHRIATPLTNHGAYHWRVRPRYNNGRDGGWSEVRELVVKLPVPMAGTPSDSFHVPSADPELTWPAVSESAQYEWELSLVPTFNSLVDSDTTNAHSVKLSQSLANNRTYHWRVRLTEFGIAGDWSAVNTFVVVLPKPKFSLLTSSETFRTLWHDSLLTSVTGDFDSDGRPDLAILTMTKLVQFYQQSDGSFGTPISLETGIELQQIIACDVNHDGATDFVVAGNAHGSEESIKGTIGTFLRDPESHILAAPVWTSTQFWIGRIAPFDLNDDDALDLAVVGIGSDATGRVSTLAGLTTGEFHDEQVVPEVVPFFLQYYDGTFSQPPFVHAGDLNNDGLDDLVFWSSVSELTVLTAARGRDFSSSKLSVHASFWPGFPNFDIGDLNGDGFKDIVVSDWSNNPQLDFFLQEDGELKGPFVQPTGQYVVQEQIKVVDIDDDGLNDIVTDEGSPVVYFQTPENTYGAGSFRGVGSMAVLLAVVDWDSDGDLDFVGVDYNYSHLVVVQQLP